jgi:hypothetical protein
MNMNLGRRIKNAYGIEPSVDFIYFNETEEHLVMLIKTYDMCITHKQVNAVLNMYPLGRWIFVESRLTTMRGVGFSFKGMEVGTELREYMLSIYRVDKKKAMAELIKREAGKIEKKSGG